MCHFLVTHCIIIMINYNHNNNLLIIIMLIFYSQIKSILHKISDILCVLQISASFESFILALKLPTALSTNRLRVSSSTSLNWGSLHSGQLYDGGAKRFWLNWFISKFNRCIANLLSLSASVCGPRICNKHAACFTKIVAALCYTNGCLENILN